MLTQPADAKVVYTPAHRHVLLHHPLGLDLNGDGIIDLRISRNRFYDTAYSFATELSALGVSRNRVGGHAGTYRTTSRTFYNGSAYALRAGEQIGALLHFPDRNPGSGFMAMRWGARGGDGTHTYFCIGQWNNVKGRYLGLKFEIKKQVHYGWARLNEYCNRHGGPDKGAQALLTGYAYETVPNTPIIAGKTKGPDVITLEPGSLGRLAQGSAGRLGK